MVASVKTTPLVVEHSWPRPSLLSLAAAPLASLRTEGGRDSSAAVWRWWVENRPGGGDGSGSEQKMVRAHRVEEEKDEVPG